jgi:hypothetical protein
MQHMKNSNEKNGGGFNLKKSLPGNKFPHPHTIKPRITLAQSLARRH